MTKYKLAKFIRRKARLKRLQKNRRIKAAHIKYKESNKR